MKKLHLAVLTAMLLWLCGVGTGTAAYPDKPIHLVVPWAAGGGTDVVARSLAEAMKQFTDVNVIVENITGAGGSTGNKKVADATPDGYTVLFNGDTDILGSISVMKTDYSLDSFKYIGGVFYSPTWILTHKDSGISSIEDFLAKAKAEPNKLTLGSTTPSGAQMVMCVSIQEASKAPFRIIPYQGGKDISKALLGNQVTAGIIHAPVMLPEIKAGDIKVIGTGGSLANCTFEPLRSMKPLKELDIPVEMGIYRGLLVPKDTPDDVVAALTDIVKKATLSEEFTAFGNRFGFLPQWCDGPAFEKNIKDQLPGFQRMSK